MIKEKILNIKELKEILEKYPDQKIYDLNTKKYILLINYLENETRK